jgi:hypothetical protein
MSRKEKIDFIAEYTNLTKSVTKLCDLLKEMYPVLNYRQSALLARAIIESIPVALSKSPEFRESLKGVIKDVEKM